MESYFYSIMKKNTILFVLSLFPFFAFSQTDEEIISDIYTNSLSNGQSYTWLDHLSNNIGSRLSGSLGAEKAVDWTKQELELLNLDKVWLQPVMVPKWVRGIPEFAFIETSPGKTIKVNVCALGGSISTPSTGIKAKIIEVSGIEELEKLGSAEIQGKIVFFNRPMNSSLINTFESYGGCVDQRYSGAMEASKYGALAVIVRSMNLRIDELPHTGSMTYGDISPEDRIPSAAISTKRADLLSSMVKLDSDVQFFLKQNCKQLADVLSYNVIGEIRISFQNT